MVSLRDYQQRAIDQLYQWFRENPVGNPCIEMPTGSGKSHVIAGLCEYILRSWPDQKILMLTHVKELIEQNYLKLLKHWPSAPVGIYSAGLGEKNLGKSITIAGIQSVYKKASEIGHIDLVIVDEAHLINHRSTGMYRDLLANLEEINPRLRIVGLTATPYRLGHGLITDEPAIFSSIISPTSITELISLGYLAPLKSKRTKSLLDTSGVAKRGGEYVESELAKVVDIPEKNDVIVQEIIARSENRKSWLVFCTGVEHAENIAESLKSAGIKSECVTGKTPATERSMIIDSYRAGEIQALTSANVLTTGFDAPNTDLLVFLRPTLSPGLYVQMAGRGMRIKNHAKDCLVLDFAGNIWEHGPITAITVPEKTGTGMKKKSVKQCPECDEILLSTQNTCSICGYEFPKSFKRSPPSLSLRNDNIMYAEPEEVAVTYWIWEFVVSKNGNSMISLEYFTNPKVKGNIKDFLLLDYLGYPGRKAWEILDNLAANVGVHIPAGTSMQDICQIMEKTSPKGLHLTVIRQNKYHIILEHRWEMC
jgi:DNA repair protein RadD